MPHGSLPYRTPTPPRAPYAAAWREYAWRRRSGQLLSAFWLLGLIALAVRLRTWLLVVILVPAPLTSLCLWGFRCPRCDRRFAGSERWGWWGAARAERCAHCGLPRGAPGDPDAYAAASSGRSSSVN